MSISLQRVFIVVPHVSYQMTAEQDQSPEAILFPPTIQSAFRLTTTSVQRRELLHGADLWLFMELVSTLNSSLTDGNQSHLLYAISILPAVVCWSSHFLLPPVP